MNIYNFRPPICSKAERDQHNLFRQWTLEFSDSPPGFDWKALSQLGIKAVAQIRPLSSSSSTSSSSSKVK